MIEYAIMKNGEIVNVCTTDTPMSADEVTKGMIGGPFTVKPLDEVPLDVCKRYEYWDTRP